MWVINHYFARIASSIHFLLFKYEFKFGWLLVVFQWFKTNFRWLDVLMPSLPSAEKGASFIYSLWLY